MNVNTPLVSVIVPNYNHAPYLLERLHSIINQSYTHIELIILDDFSTDQSRKVIEAFCLDKPQIKTIFNTKNSGSTFFQWKKGIEACKGEYIWIAESDDVAELGFIEKCMHRFQNNNQLGVVFAASAWIDEHSKVFHKPEHENNERFFANNNQLVKEFLRGPLIYNASSAIFRAELLKNIDFDQLTNYKYAGDWLFWSQLAKGSQALQLKERLNYFRRHTGNVSTQSDALGLNFIEGFKIVKSLFLTWDVSFLEKSKTIAFWMKKLAHSKIATIENLNKQFGLEGQCYFWLFKLLK
jgi:glycosyltransferase involved in cell wall biosynthesis